ncbi:hypothetical protein OPV22_000533 [Ensete ventricosum]|uniref:DC1 domain-containing protein n=1 Tax=Ensete ventricosum TaxID=4639 RepID=A0AAV8RVL4_ENSVE|nr:hypothetical protein OPV22_000533 [Ensete ventricosum]
MKKILRSSSRPEKPPAEMSTTGGSTDDSSESPASTPCGDVDDHNDPSCSSLPQTVSFFAHPQHDLTLVSKVDEVQGSDGEGECELCFEKLDARFYHCKACLLSYHPTCALLSPTLTESAS